MYLRLHDTLQAEIVRRHRRKSNMCIEVIFCNDYLPVPSGRINTLREAEACGFWVMLRPQRKKGHTHYNGRQVFQLFLTPVHPKKRREMKKTITPLNSQHARETAHRATL